MDIATQERGRDRADQAHLRSDEHAGERENARNVDDFLSIPFHLQAIAGNLFQNALHFPFLLFQRSVLGTAPKRAVSAISSGTVSLLITG